MEAVMDDPWFNTEEAAQHVRRAAGTLEKLRVYGGGPRYSKQGRSVRYRLSDLDAWMTAGLVSSTSERIAA
jgi:hypothetical protein